MGEVVGWKFFCRNYVQWKCWSFRLLVSLSQLSVAKHKSREKIKFFNRGGAR